MEAYRRVVGHDDCLKSVSVGLPLQRHRRYGRVHDFMRVGYELVVASRSKAPRVEIRYDAKRLSLCDPGGKVEKRRPGEVPLWLDSNHNVAVLVVCKEVENYARLKIIVVEDPVVRVDEVVGETRHVECRLRPGNAAIAHILSVEVSNHTVDEIGHG